MFHKIIPGAKIIILAGTPTKKEMAENKVFGAKAYSQLSYHLKAAGISIESCSLMYAFQSPAPAGHQSNMCGPKTIVNNMHKSIVNGSKEYSTVNRQEYVTKFPTYNLPFALGSGASKQYLKPSYLPELWNLHKTIKELQPNIVITLGQLALWAMTTQANLSAFRGAVIESETCECKVLPTYDPIMVNKMVKHTPFYITDFKKALRESNSPEIRAVDKEIWLDPDLESIAEWERIFLPPNSTKLLSFDIETANKEITMISFSTSPTNALVIPFFDERKEDGNYWPTLFKEQKAWEFVQKFLAHPCPKLAQNGKYDIEWLYFAYHIKINNYAEDTMLLAYSLQPEWPKGLGFLAALHTDNPTWKHLSKVATGKKDE